MWEPLLKGEFYKADLGKRNEGTAEGDFQGSKKKVWGAIDLGGGRLVKRKRKKLL